MKRADFQNKQQQQQLSHKVSAELPNSWSIKERCKSNVSRVLLLGSGQFKLAVGLLATVEAPVTVAELCDHSQQQQRSQKFTQTGCRPVRTRRHESNGSQLLVVALRQTEACCGPSRHGRGTHDGR